MALKAVIYVWLFIAAFSIVPSMGGNNNLTPNGTKCFCPDDSLTFTCNILGGGATVWSGTTLNCVPNGITLRHDSDSFQPGTFSYCDGAITNEIVRQTEGNRFISRVNFTAGIEFNNTVIECSVQDPEISPVGNSTIRIIPVSDYLQELRRVNVSNVNMTEITFNWTEVNSICPDSVTYNVASDCVGVTCIATRNAATCSNLPIASVCAFSIDSEVCGQTETVNNAINVTLKSPRANITSVYAAGSPSALTKVMISIYQEPFFSIADGEPSNVTKYSFSYSNANMSIPACQEHGVLCDFSIDAATFTCPPSTDIVVTLSASNRFGQGPRSDPTTIGCNNEFVSVQYDSTTSVITCDFLDKMDTSIKSCSVAYGQCDEMLVPVLQQNSTVEDPYSIELLVPRSIDCYKVKASNGSFTIIVEGRNLVKAGSNGAKYLIALIVIPFGVIIAVVLIVAIIAIAQFRKRKHKRLHQDRRDSEQANKKKPLSEFVPDKHNDSSGTEQIVEKFQLKESAGRFKIMDINKKHKVTELEQKLRRKYSKGYIYYKFQHELETLSENTEVILMDKAANLFSSNISSLKQFEEKKKPLKESLNNFTIFVRSTGSDVEEGSVVLYEVLKTKTTKATKTTAV